MSSRLRTLQIKASTWYLSALEKRFKDWAIPQIPLSIQTYHLTLMTLPCILATLIVGIQSRHDITWLHALSVLVVIQYICDLLDGELGRRRATGLIRWGFYADHFLDYVFIGSIITAYYLTVPQAYQVHVFLMMVIVGGFFVSTYLEHGATGKFVMAEYGFGPTEARLVFVIFNTFFAMTGKILLGKFVPFILASLIAAVIINAYRKQRQLWKKDLSTHPDSTFSHPFQKAAIISLIIIIVYAVFAFL